MVGFPVRSPMVSLAVRGEFRLNNRHFKAMASKTIPRGAVSQPIENNKIC